MNRGLSVGFWEHMLLSLSSLPIASILFSPEPSTRYPDCVRGNPLDGADIDETSISRLATET